MIKLDDIFYAYKKYLHKLKIKQPNNLKKIKSTFMFKYNLYHLTSSKILKSKFIFFLTKRTLLTIKFGQYKKKELY